VDAAPFNDAHGAANGVALTGVFWAIGLAAALAATVVLLLPARGPSWLPGALAGAAGLLFLLMPLLAISTWPPSGLKFWDSGSDGSSFGSSSFSAYAGVGWYLALAAGLASAFAAFLAWTGRGAAPMPASVAPAPAPTPAPASRKPPTAQETAPAPKARKPAKAAAKPAAKAKGKATAKAPRGK
jgi:hypothetical protein